MGPSRSRTCRRAERGCGAARHCRRERSWNLSIMEPESVKATVNVLLVEDHPMFRERLASVISKRGDMSVCGEANNVNDALRLAESLCPNIAIVDITLRRSNGLDFLKDIKARGLDLPVLVLSMHDEAI